MPFFSVCASEFIEMFVGVGASRVRDLFNQAKEAAPAIIFIDELDAIGRSRGGAPAPGGHDEREQTLNQILTEMDGFSPNSGVIVLAATNRPDVLDSALLRPGRFDRRVTVQPPDQKGRLEILKVHTRRCRSRPTSTSTRSPRPRPGWSAPTCEPGQRGRAAGRPPQPQDGRDADFDALEKILLGAERRVMMTQDDRERTAYHEAGHALVGCSRPAPTRSQGLDHPARHGARRDVSAPEADRFNYDEDYLQARSRSRSAAGWPRRSCSTTSPRAPSPTSSR